MLHDAPLRIASVDAVLLEDFVQSLTRAETEDDDTTGEPVYIDAPENRWFDVILQVGPAEMDATAASTVSATQDLPNRR